MRYLLIPVKDLSRAKQRLAPLLTPSERTRLAWTLFENTCAVALRTRAVDRIAIVTLYQPAIELAEKYGLEVIREHAQTSESASVDFGSRELAARGVEAVLRLPLDLPLLTAADIETIFAHAAPAPSAVLAPSRDGTGTNALLRCPPTLFPSHFGLHSLAQHLAEAKKTGAQCKVLELPRIALDLDEPSDLLELWRCGANSPALALLEHMRIAERLRQTLNPASSDARP